jgi:Cu-processing system ATP-binding protein
MIAFRALTKRYGNHPAVTDLTFAVHRGEVVALLGPNGSGKTTALKAAAGLIRPTSGGVVLGDPGRPATDPRARRVISYLPQRVAFPDALTGHEVVEFYRELRGVPPERTAEVLRFASLNGASGRGVGTYSGGMVQRLGLAVAMLPAAPVLLLDEPTAALDPDGLAAFYRLVDRRRQEHATLLFTSHQLGDAERLADRFVVLANGRLAAAMTAADLHARLSARGVLRLRLGTLGPGVKARVEALIPDGVWEGEELLVAGAPERRPAIIDAVRSAGGEIRDLTTREARLDQFFRELTGERS